MEWSGDKTHVAFVRDRLCKEPPCESLYLGTTVESATALEGLADGRESSNEIAWTPDSRRVAFLVNGRQLRIYDAQTLKPAGKVNLFAEDDSTASPHRAWDHVLGERCGRDVRRLPARSRRMQGGDGRNTLRIGELVNCCELAIH